MSKSGEISSIGYEEALKMSGEALKSAEDTEALKVEQEILELKAELEAQFDMTRMIRTVKNNSGDDKLTEVIKQTFSSNE